MVPGHTQDLSLLYAVLFHTSLWRCSVCVVKMNYQEMTDCPDLSLLSAVPSRRPCVDVQLLCHWDEMAKD